MQQRRISFLDILTLVMFVPFLVVILCATGFLVTGLVVGARGLLTAEAQPPAPRQAYRQIIVLPPVRPAPPEVSEPAAPQPGPELAGFEREALPQPELASPAAVVVEIAPAQAASANQETTAKPEAQPETPAQPAPASLAAENPVEPPAEPAGPEAVAAETVSEAEPAASPAPYAENPPAANNAPAPAEPEPVEIAPPPPAPAELPEVTIVPLPVQTPVPSQPAPPPSAGSSAPVPDVSYFDKLLEQVKQ